MNEGRIVLCVFGAAAILMIALPVATLLMPTRAVPADEAMTGAVSQFFLTAQPPATSGQHRTVLPAITRLFPPGTPDATAFAQFAASGFTCVPDANAASCFRAVTLSSGCTADWRASLTFDATGKVATTEADSRTTCR